MDAKTEGMMDGMMDGMMCRHDPRKLFEKIMQIEQAKVSLYRELAQDAPNECLRQGITNMFDMSQCSAKMFTKIAEAYGFTNDPPAKAPVPGLPPYFFAEEKKE